MALPDQVELLCMAIQKKASAETERILQDARARRDRLVQQGIQEIRRQQEQQKLQLKRQAFQDARRKVDAAELKARRMVMATREKIFDQVLSEGRKKLQELLQDRQEYSRLLRGMIQKAADIILGSGGKGLEIRCRQEDRDIMEDVIRDLPSPLSGKVTLSARPADIPGGVMAFSQDGKQLVDLSFGSILSRIEPEIRSVVAEMLFKEAGST